MMLALTPRADTLVRSLLDDAELLKSLVNGLGSPIGVLLPQRLGENVAAFRETYRRHRLTGRIHFAHKANRSSALLRELATTDAGVDVASTGELHHALGAGFHPSRIVATGPKNREFRWLCARAGVTVSVDSLDELTDLAGIVAGFGLPRLPVTVRLKGFGSPGVQVMSRRSRFGIAADRLDEALDLLAKHDDALEFTGLAYHLDTTALPEKAVALEGCLAALDRCRERGLRPRSLGIGGGFGVDYLADGEQWERWTSELAQAVLGTRAPMTWQGYGYGLRNEAGVLRGALNLYPAHRPLAGPRYLDRLLETPGPSLRQPLGELLLDEMYDLDVEPGRALLDQCGLTLARVIEVRDEDGDTFVALDLNARDVNTEEHGVLMDPVLIGVPGGEPVGAYLLGNLCLESDLITRRRVVLAGRPRPGDVMAFVNTAGYFMDFSATHAVRQPIATKVAAWRSGDAWKWCLDERYWPLESRSEV